VDAVQKHYGMTSLEESANVIRKYFDFTKRGKIQAKFIQFESLTGKLYNNSMVTRKIAKEFKQLLKEYPVVTVTGPRQSGKTTLVRMECNSFNYANLEHPETRELAQFDPKAFFEQFKTPLIIDEFQKVPELLSYIQIDVDNQSKNGLYVLTGSYNLKMSNAVTQSLAGRTALLTLLPFCIAEIPENPNKRTREETLFKGFLPRVHDKKQEPYRAYRNYFQTYVSRDLKDLIHIKDAALFERFCKLLAGRVGQVFNANSLANETGVSHTTINHWLSILETSYITFRLQPYFKNFNKRIIKSPKIYFIEPGLASYLLGIENVQQLQRDPLFGNLFENLVVVEALKQRYNKGKDANLYFFRDNNKNEVDIIFAKGNKFIPIEIKSALTFNTNFLKGIRYFKNTTGQEIQGYVVYGGDLCPHFDDATVLNYKDVDKIFKN